MAQPTGDQAVLKRIEELVAQKHQLQHQEALSEEDRGTLHHVQTELAQCWDLLRQRRALRTSGQDPEKAEVRPTEVVEKYEQ